MYNILPSAEAAVSLWSTHLWGLRAHMRSAESATGLDPGDADLALGQWGPGSAPAALRLARSSALLPWGGLCMGTFTLAQYHFLKLS